MIMGIPTDAAAAAFIGVAVIAISVSMMLWFLIIPIGLVLRFIAKHDDRAFRILGLYIDTKMRYPKSLKNFWGACSYATFVPRKLKK
jgi:type IV secretion system protein VirB3